MGNVSMLWSARWLWEYQHTLVLPNVLSCRCHSLLFFVTGVPNPLDFSNFWISQVLYFSRKKKNLPYFPVTAERGLLQQEVMQQLSV